jgi:hypothetical protein
MNAAIFARVIRQFLAIEVFFIFLFELQFTQSTGGACDFIVNVVVELENVI